MSFWRRLIIGTLAILLSVPSFAQKKSEQVDSLVNLLSAQSMELIERHGVNYRKVTGPARFLHNNTYLICDTALWNVSMEVIDAWGHVKILQNSTVLTSDKLTYRIEDNLAQFRGDLVQLEDKDRDMLRTKYLDYNTKDSVAVFRNGASMKDKDGQIIESLNGTYDSKTKTFTFTDNVNMFTDSIFVKTTRLEYHSKENMAIFGRNTDAWKDDDMLSSDAGWYDRNRELFFFTDNVHGMTDTQESWSDSLYFYRNTMDVEMLGNVQLTDTTRNATAVAGRLVYTDSLSHIVLTRSPALIGVTDSTGTARDTVYVGADTLSLRTIPKCVIEEREYKDAQKRLDDMANDAIGTYRRKAYEEAKKSAEDAKKQDEDYMAEQDAKAKREALSAQNAQDEHSAPPATTPPATTPPATVPPVADSLSLAGNSLIVPPSDSLSVLSDSLSVSSDSLLVASDSLSVASDSLLVARDSLLAVSDSLMVQEPQDSTKVGFIEGISNVRLYRDDFQLRCDLLRFNELDSLVRMYKSPNVWNEGNRQYAADSIYVSFGENNLDKAYLMSNAFVTIEEAPQCYDQIRSVEMLAYFNDDGTLRRFDATGGTDAVFYIKEDSTFATVNKSQAKLMCAILKDGEIDNVAYFEDAKNNAYPLAQLRNDERTLKGFNWTPEDRPAGPEDITVYRQRPSQRRAYAARPRAKFRHTDTYFPGYMAGVYKKIEENERKAAERAARRDSLNALPKTDSLSMVAPGLTDFLALTPADSLTVDPKDSISMTPTLVDDTHETGTQASADTTATSTMAPADTAVTRPVIDPREEEKARKEAEKAALKQAKLDARAAKVAAREAKWARLDSLDRVKEEAKAEAKAEKARQKKLKAILADRKQAEKDEAKLEKYRLRYEKRYGIKPEEEKEEKPKEPNLLNPESWEIKEEID